MITEDWKVRDDPSAGGRELGRREARYNRVRASILDCGLAMFERNGFDKTTISEIADATGIARRTFFRYFASKEDIAFAWMEDDMEMLNSMLEQKPAEKAPYEALREALLTLGQKYDANIVRDRKAIVLIFQTPLLSGRFLNEMTNSHIAIQKILLGDPLPEDPDGIRMRVRLVALVSAFTEGIRLWLERESGPITPLVTVAMSALDG